MKPTHSDTNTDLQRGFEPLRTIFAVLVLLLGFVAGARAEDGVGTIEANTPDGQSCDLVALAGDIHFLIGGLDAATISARTGLAVS